jgi:hypothetical protein
MCGKHPLGMSSLMAHYNSWTKAFELKKPVFYIFLFYSFLSTKGNQTVKGYRVKEVRKSKKKHFSYHLYLSIRTTFLNKEKLFLVKVSM